MLVGDGILITVPGHETVDAAQAIDDASGIVGVSGQRAQVGALLAEALQNGALTIEALVGDVVEPGRQLAA